jgi:hypothetical protein
VLSKAAQNLKICIHRLCPLVRWTPERAYLAVHRQVNQAAMVAGPARQSFDILILIVSNIDHRA